MLSSLPRTTPHNACITQLSREHPLGECANIPGKACSLYPLTSLFYRQEAYRLHQPMLPQLSDVATRRLQKTSCTVTQISRLQLPRYLKSLINGSLGGCQLPWRHLPTYLFVWTQPASIKQPSLVLPENVTANILQPSSGISKILRFTAQEPALA